MAEVFIVTVHCSNCRTTHARSFPIGTTFDQESGFDGHLLDITNRKQWMPGEPYVPPTKVLCQICGVGPLTRRERDITDPARLGDIPATKDVTNV